MKKKIVLTGGGTAGHVMPHIAWMDQFKQDNWEAFYIGSNGVEKELIEKQGIPFFEFSVGKLRRYWSWQNFIDPFKVLLGLVQSLYFLIKIRPQVVLSKGGFVSLPVSVAAWCLRIPLIIHESDVTPGLANKLSKPFASQVLYSFAETAKYLPSSAIQLVPPVRKEVLLGNKAKGLDFLGWDSKGLPILLVMGGSLGAVRVNQAIQKHLDKLLLEFRIIHLTGKGKTISEDRDGYKSFEFLHGDLPNVLAAADLVVARAGANSLFEFLALKKPMLLIPLEIGSRGDQVLNAQSFVAQGWAVMLRETEVVEKLLCALDQVMRDRREILIAQDQGVKRLAESPQLLEVLEQDADN